jgi:hypothetical protein
MARVRSLLIGGAVVATSAYFLDPDQGAARRERVRAFVESRLDRARDSLDWAAAQLEERARAALEQIGAGHDREDDDLSVLSRVESVVLAEPAVPRGAVECEVVDGLVVLRGEIAGAEVEGRLVEAVGGVRGVREVRSLLRVPETLIH